MNKSRGTSPGGPPVRSAAAALSGAALILSLAVPSAALAQPIEIELERSSNDNAVAVGLARTTGSQRAAAEAANEAINTNTAHQDAGYYQTQVTQQRASVEQSASNRADVDAQSEASLRAYSGDARALGSFSIANVRSTQLGDASAAGDATSLVSTGPASNSASGSNASTGGDARPDLGPGSHGGIQDAGAWSAAGRGGDGGDASAPGGDGGGAR